MILEKWTDLINYAKREVSSIGFFDGWNSTSYIWPNLFKNISIFYVQQILVGLLWNIAYL
jgi:hypothetical protein